MLDFRFVLNELIALAIEAVLGARTICSWLLLLRLVSIEADGARLSPDRRLIELLRFLREIVCCRFERAGAGLLASPSATASRCVSRSAASLSSSATRWWLRREWWWCEWRPFEWRPFECRW